jgi:L-malate glycosyltransferase
VKVLILSAGNSIHTQRWVEALHARGSRVFLATQHSLGAWIPPGGVKVHELPFRGNVGYFLNAVAVRRLVGKLRPDIINAHYASGYGTTAALSGVRPLLLSVWGSDVFDFPYESWIKGLLMRRNLRRATRLASTSRVMAQQVRSLVPELPPALVTPFGVDCDRFCPDTRQDSNFITLGTVKTLAHKYGIDVLITAFARVLRDPQIRGTEIESRLRLMLVGGGEQRSSLEALAQSLGIHEKVVFVGQVAHAEVPAWLNKLDIYVAASRLDSESFGVAAVEASACGLPVIVSDAGGLPEVVRNGITGIVVARDNSAALAGALKQLLLDRELRVRMGLAGREFVVSNYEWAHCVDTMEAAYREVVAGCSE